MIIPFIIFDGINQSSYNPLLMNRLLGKTDYPIFDKIAVLAIVVLVAFSSCKTTKNSYYFQTVPRDTAIKSSATQLAESKIKKNDLLAIGISSLNREEDATYNAASVTGTSSTGTAAAGSGYLVDANGNIQLHKLGIMHVEGMTRRELKDKIQKDIQPYLKDPIVTVRYLNHKVTILGEISKPQVIQMPEEQLSLLEVLGVSGDVSQFARRDNILIIRETSSGKQLKRINLENHSIFNSEWYYLQPDDVVYVEPNDKKVNEENRNRRLQTLSIALAGVSTAIIILDRIFR